MTASLRPVRLLAAALLALAAPGVGRAGDVVLRVGTIVIANGELGRQDRNEQSHNRFESFIELLRVDRS